ncbi:MAG: two-component system, OmpR family, response regulator [Acidobacteriota bacterium]|jgi:DNA-binding response OmpR family regulator|nr:two-component system, OmpR family, response regulator [Acidobacteriota bacterium]
MPPKAKILVIDDDATLLGAVRRLLLAAGFDVVTSDSALRLPQLVQREKPDLILLDIEMPALNGEHVLDFTKLFDFLRETPIVLHSSKSEEDLQALVERSSAVGYIRKTSNALSLVSQVKRFLRPTDQ